MRFSFTDRVISSIDEKMMIKKIVRIARHPYRYQKTGKGPRAVDGIDLLKIFIPFVFFLFFPGIPQRKYLLWFLKEDPT